MKRMMTLLLTLALLLALPGCNSETEADTSLDSNRAFFHYGVLREACATEDTVYFTSGDLVHYYDKTTGISGILCGKAECEHSTATDSTCNAYIGSVSYELQLYNGRLYWIKSGGGMHICSMALDGTDHRVDRTVGSEFYSHSRGLNGVILHRGLAYLWVENKSVRDGKETVSVDLAAVPLDSDGELHVIFQEELTDFAVAWYDYLTLQAYGDDLYIITDYASGRSQDGSEGYPDLSELHIRRYNAVMQELTTLYYDSASPITYTVEMWAMDDGIVFVGDKKLGDAYSRQIYRLDFESGELTALFEPTGLQIAENMVAGCEYTSYGKSNPSNPWGMTLAPQDLEVSGELHVVIQNFAGDVLVDDTYPLNGIHNFPVFCGNDDKYAYFFSDRGYSDNDGHTRYMSLIGVALDGSGMEVLCSEEEYYKSTFTHGSSEWSKTLDDGTVITVKDDKFITVTTPDGETVTMTVEELLENGYQP